MASTASGRSVPVPQVLVRGASALSRDRIAWSLLAAGGLVSFLLSLWLTRGLTFHGDDYLYFIANRGFDFRVLIGPHNGNLIFVPRLLYAIVLALGGVRDYIVFRLLEALGVVLVAGLFFALARGHVGAGAALAVSFILLFFGSAWQDTVDPVGLAHVYGVAAGLGALLALAPGGAGRRPGALAPERPGRRPEALACALLVLAVITFSTGLSFVFAALISVLLGPERWRRLWIVAAPVAVYAVWFAAPKLNHTPFTSGTGFALRNVDLVPAYFLHAARSVTDALTGLGYSFTNPASYTIDASWGYLLTALIVLGVVGRFVRARVPIPRAFWVALALLVAYWGSSAMVSDVLTRGPDQNRYLYDGGVIVLLVLVTAASGWRPGPGALWALFGVVALCLIGNVALLRAGGGYLRSSTASDRAMLASVDLARGHVQPNFVPQGEPLLTFLDDIAGGSGPYLAAARRNGSFAFTPAELRAQSEPVRELADRNLVAALRLGLVSAPVAGLRNAQCLSVSNHPGPLDLTVRSPGVLLRSTRVEQVSVRRFAGVAAIPVGSLAPRRLAALRLPLDHAPEPWHIELPPGNGVSACHLSSR